MPYRIAYVHLVNRGAVELRVAMARRGLTQDDVAKLVDASQAQVSAWARDSGKPSRRASALLLRHLGIDPLWWDEEVEAA